jgi:hypothetical protein
MKVKNILKRFFPFLSQGLTIAQVSLKLVILIPQPPNCWDYRCLPPVYPGGRAFKEKSGQLYGFHGAYCA